MAFWYDTGVKMFDVADFISCIRALCFFMPLEASLQITITTLSDP